MTLTLPRATDNATAPTQPQTSTERDAAYARLHTTAAARLDASLRRFVRDLRRHGLAHGAALQSAFIQRHTLAMARAYVEGHQAGQRTYWQQMSAAPQRQRIVDPDVALVRKRMAFYAPSVAKMAREGMTAYIATLPHALSESEPYMLAGDTQGDALGQWYDGLGARVELQAELGWGGLNDGYGDAGAGDVGNPYAQLYWVLGFVKTEHCSDCLAFAANSPYDPPGSGGHELDATPGDGHSECGAACKCFLSYEAPDVLEQRAFDTIAEQLNQQEALTLQGKLATLAPPPASADQLSTAEKQALDKLRAAIDHWNLVRGPIWPGMPHFSTPAEGAAWQMPTWEYLTEEQKDALADVYAALIEWNDARAAGQGQQFADAGRDAIKLFNPNHDARGRFAPGGMGGQHEHESGGGGRSRGGRSAAKSAGGGGGRAAAQTTVEWAHAGAKARLTEVFGHELSDHEMIGLTGARPGSRIVVAHAIDVFGPHGSYHAQYSVLPPSENDPHLRLMDWFYHAGAAGSEHEARMDPRILRDQVHGAGHLGIESIHVKSQQHSRDAVWLPRLGFDAPLNINLRGETRDWASHPMPPDGHSLRMVSDLLRFTAGARWWFSHALHPGLDFDLHPGSYSIKRLDQYLRAKKLGGVYGE